jgi:hypothetical protein
LNPRFQPLEPEHDLCQQPGTLFPQSFVLRTPTQLVVVLRKRFTLLSQVPTRKLGAGCPSENATSHSFSIFDLGPASQQFPDHLRLRLQPRSREATFGLCQPHTFWSPASRISASRPTTHWALPSLLCRLVDAPVQCRRAGSSLHSSILSDNRPLFLALRNHRAPLLQYLPPSFF